VTSTGVVISLGLTHEALGRLIGAQRPTVTLALRSLGERGAVERRKDRSWLVIERPGDIALTAATLTDGCQPVPLAPPEMNGARPSEMNGARPSEMNGARPSEMDGAQPV
jgi:hypothetical protein